ncbi:MAG: DinB family protein [Phycisphaerales bacterium]
MASESVRQAAAPEPADRIERLPVPDLVHRWAIGVERFDPRVFELPADELDRAWPASAGVGKWPVRVLLGHLADAEACAVHRLRRVAAEPGCELTGWDQDAFVDAGHYGVIAMTPDGEPWFPPIGAAVAVIHAIRQWTAPWLASLPPDRWERTGLHHERGPVTVRSLVATGIWHLEHHARFLNRKIDRVLGPSS